MPFYYLSVILVTSASIINILELIPIIDILRSVNSVHTSNKSSWRLKIYFTRLLAKLISHSCENETSKELSS